MCNYDAPLGKATALQRVAGTKQETVVKAPPTATQLRLACEGGFDFGATVAAEFEHGAIAQDNPAIAAGSRMQLFNAIQIDDGRTVNALELVGIKPGFQDVHCLTQQMRLGAYLKLDVIIRRLDPINLVHVQKTDASGGLDHQPRQPARRRLGIGGRDRKSTRLNSSHGSISYAVFCL